MKFLKIIILIMIITPAMKSDAASLKFWYLSGEEKIMNDIISDFEKSNPDIHVKSQRLTWDFGLDKMILAVAAEVTPDVCELGSTWVPRFSQNGVLMDISDDVKDIYDGYLMWDWVKWDNKIYGAPWFIGTRALFYNKSLFKQAGLDPDKPPKTWSELKSASQKISALGNGVYGYGITAGQQYAPWQAFLPYVWSNGGDVISIKKNEPLVTKPSFVNALKFLNDLKPYSIVERQSELDRIFAENEKIGMYISGAWNFSLILNRNPLLDYGVTFVPAPDNNPGNHISFAGGEAFVVFKNSKHKEAAVKLIKYLISAKQTMRVVRTQKNILPAAKSAINDPFFENNIRQKFMFLQAKSSKAPPSHSRWTEIQEHLNTAIENVVLSMTPISPETSLKRLDKKIRLVLDDTKRLEKSSLSDKNITIIIFGLIGIVILSFIVYYKMIAGPLKANLLQRQKDAYLFISPWVLLFISFGLYPLMYTLVISFTHYNILTSRADFIGIRNYIEVIKSKDFQNALRHTLIYAVGTIPFTTTLSILCAIGVNKVFFGKKFFQGGVFLPTVTSIIVIAAIFKMVYSKDGSFNMVIQFLGLKPLSKGILMDTRFALAGIMGMAVWSSFGYYTILYIAGLQTIPKSLYEAAAIDGADNWVRFWEITLPQLKPITIFVVVINTIRSLQVFPEIFTMTQGGPEKSTTTVVYHLYEIGFHHFKMGKASAVAYVLFLIILVFSAMQMKFMRFEKDN